MTKKKRTTGSKATPTAKVAPVKKPSSAVWIIGGAAILVVVAIVALSGRGSGTGAGAGAGAPAASGASADEQKYIGRLLPAGYEAPKVADLALYPETVKMTDITATDDGEKLSVPVSDITTSKIVKFEYAKAGSRALPLIAYVKPSGKLFVAVSFCPPCEGEGQRIEAPGILVCESCGTKRDLEQGVGISGACKLYPLDELPVTVAGDRISIDKTVLDNWTAQPKDRPIG